jgi:hypothetical protein
MPFDTDEVNVNRLATILQSEASVGNATERAGVAWTVLNRMTRNATRRVADVERAYSRSQQPTAAMRALAQSLLTGSVADPTAGATHYYSPRSMPKQGESTAGYDVGGGLEQVAGLNQQSYRPGWVNTFQQATVQNARPSYYKFYRSPGSGPVR